MGFLTNCFVKDLTNGGGMKDMVVELQMIWVL